MDIIDFISQSNTVTDLPPVGIVIYTFFDILNATF